MKKLWLYSALIVLLVVVAYWKLTEPPAQGENLGESKATETQRKLLGVWQDNYQGKRTMTLNENGTGTMLVELSGWRAALAARKLRFDMEWKLEEPVLTKRSVGGDPADKVNMILRMKGDTAEDTILELTEDRLLLLDKDGKTQYDWRRVHPTNE
jgi:hypothetical protein